MQNQLDQLKSSDKGWSQWSLLHQTHQITFVSARPQQLHFKPLTLVYAVCMPQHTLVISCKHHDCDTLHKLIHAISVILAMQLDSPSNPTQRAISATSNHSTSALTQGNSRANCWTSSVSANTCDFSHPCHACWFPQQPTTCHKGQYLQQAITPISTSASTQGNSRVNCWTSSVSAYMRFDSSLLCIWIPQATQHNEQNLQQAITPQVH